MKRKHAVFAATVCVGAAVLYGGILGAEKWAVRWPYDVPEPAQTDPMAIHYVELTSDDRPRYVRGSPPFYQRVVLDLTADGQPVHIDRTFVCRHTYEDHGIDAYVVDIRQRTMSVRLPNGAAVLAMAPYCSHVTYDLSKPKPHPEGYRPMVIYLHPDQNRMDYYFHPAGYDAPASHLRWGNITIEQSLQGKPTPPDEFWWARGMSSFDRIHAVGHGLGFEIGQGLLDVTDLLDSCPSQTSTPLVDTMADVRVGAKIDSADLIMNGGSWMGADANIDVMKNWIPMECPALSTGDRICQKSDPSKTGILTSERGIQVVQRAISFATLPEEYRANDKPENLFRAFFTLNGRCYEPSGFQDTSTLHNTMRRK